jgi:hypothetical protein
VSEVSDPTESPASNPATEPASTIVAPAVAPQYWLRVHGFPPVPIHSFPTQLNTEIVYYNDFFDPTIGRLPGDPRLHLRVGDIFIYFADGGAVLYGTATITGEVEGPLPDPRRGQIWQVPIKRDAMLKTVNKAPHAVTLDPPSGWRFLRAAREFTFIRLPAVDGAYYVEQIRSRAGGRE